jgi:hypothetical protein
MNKVVKEPVDNSAFCKSTDRPGRDWVYNKILKRYGDKGNAWTASDSFLWQGFLYYVVDYIFAVGFIGLITWLLVLTYDHFGPVKACIVAFVMLLWRVNIIVRQGNQTNRLLGAK